MCGIVGIIHTDQTTVSGELLKSMADVIHHRGPDDEGSLVERNIGLYHKRLSIIDLFSGQQPMTFGPLTLVFNGEIYNYVELRDELRQKGVLFKTTSDTEVILRMYEAYGTEAIPRLNGMFAFLLYDRRTHQLIAARDHFGIKPLYYHQTERRICFASEIKALIQHPEIPTAPNYKALNEYLTFQFLLGNHTLFDQIFKVEPGHYLLVDTQNGDVKTVKYWEPNFKIDTHHTQAYFIETLRELLEDTVQIQMRSDVPVGAYLSGGMDSSLVSILAAKNTPQQLKTFTGAFKEGKNFDETPYAREVAKTIQADMHLIYPTEKDFVELLPTLIYHLDEPVVGPGLFPQYMVSHLAAQHVKVVLGGQGGDEIFGGYTRYVVAYLEQAIKGAIYETNEEGEHIVSFNSILPNLPYLRKYVPMIKQFWSREVFEEMDRRYFHLIDRSENSLGLYTDDYRKHFDREHIFHKFQQIFNHPDTLSYFNKMTHFDMFGSLPGLLQVEDRVSMAVSLESRVPLLDRRIVDLISGMPAAMKFKGGEMKYILKRAIKDIIPAGIYNRKDKMGFPVPLHIWAQNGASDFIQDILLSQSCRERGIFNHQEIQPLIQSERAFGRSLWGVLSLEIWFQKFIDK